MANPNQDARNHGNGRYVRRPQTATRDAEAARLRGEGWTLQEIADELGFGHKCSVSQAIDRAFRDLAQPARPAREQRARELDMLWEYALDVLNRKHITVSNGKVITVTNKETGEEVPLQDDGPTMQAIAELRRINESYRKLDGVDQPAKLDMSGGVTYTINGVDTEQLK